MKPIVKGESGLSFIVTQFIICQVPLNNKNIQIKTDESVDVINRQ